MDGDGNTITDLEQLKMLGKNHFSSLFKDDGSTLILDQLLVIKHFPCFLSAKESAIMAAEVSMKEVETTLKNFKKDKSPSPDGWSVKFFLHFFDLVKDDLLKVVEQSRKEGRLS